MPKDGKYENLDIVVPQFLIQLQKENKISNDLFDVLHKLDKNFFDKKSDVTVLGAIQKVFSAGIEVLEEKQTKGETITDNVLKTSLMDVLEPFILLGQDKEAQNLPLLNKKILECSLNPETEYCGLKIPQDFGVLRRGEMYFVDQPGTNTTIHTQPFIERSNEEKSIEFAKEYYSYCCNPVDYPGSKVGQVGSQERFPITSDVLKHMEEKLGVSFSELKIYKFFDTEHKDYIMPTHGLLCHMFLMCSLATAPFYLAGGHLGNPDQHSEQFEYYSQFLIHNDERIIPNRQCFIRLLKILITVLKNKREHGSRLCEQEISIDELFPLMKSQNIGPFELYEDLIREQFRLVDNITTGDIIGFKLTATGMMFLYMCCPKI